MRAGRALRWIALVICVAQSQASLYAAEIPYYVGRQACLKCHTETYDTPDGRAA